MRRSIHSLNWPESLHRREWREMKAISDSNLSEWLTKSQIIVSPHTFPYRAHTHTVTHGPTRVLSGGVSRNRSIRLLGTFLTHLPLPPPVFPGIKVLVKPGKTPTKPIRVGCKNGISIGIYTLHTSLLMFGTELRAQSKLINKIWPKFCSKKLGVRTFRSLVGID